jgi:hypothetical protein
MPLPPPGFLSQVQEAGAEEANQADDDQVQRDDEAKQLWDKEDQEASDDGNDGGEGEVDVHGGEVEMSVGS